MPKHIVRKWIMAAFFLPHKTKGYFYKAKFCLCEILYFRLRVGENWSKQRVSFLVKNVFICVS